MIVGIHLFASIWQYGSKTLTPKAPKSRRQKSRLQNFTKIYFVQAMPYCKSKLFWANSVDPDEAAYHEPPHLDLHCLPKIISILNTSTSTLFKKTNIQLVSFFYALCVIQSRRTKLTSAKLKKKLLRASYSTFVNSHSAEGKQCKSRWGGSISSTSSWSVAFENSTTVEL